MSPAKVGVFAAGSAPIEMPANTKKTESASAPLAAVQAIVFFDSISLMVVSLDFSWPKHAGGKDRQRHGTCRTVGSLMRFPVVVKPRVLQFTLMRPGGRMGSSRWIRRVWPLSGG